MNIIWSYVRMGNLTSTQHLSDICVSSFELLCTHIKMMEHTNLP